VVRCAIPYWGSRATVSYTLGGLATTRVPWCEQDATRVPLPPTKGSRLSHEHVRPFHENWERAKGINIAALHV